MQESESRVAAVSQWLSRLASRLDASPWIWPALASIAVVLARLRSDAGTDVAALITWAERMVDGARPFVDFVEVNPPGSILLYIPAVVFGRASGLSPEVACDLLMVALIALSLGLSWQALAATSLLDRHNRSHLLAAAIAILGVMPAVAFGQREHVGIISALPILAVVAAEMNGVPATRWLRLLAGCLAGLSMVAKPHLAALLASVALYSILYTRRPRAIFGLHWIAAGATLATYLGLTYWAYPEFYSTALPKIAAVYLGWRMGILAMIANPLLPILGMAFLGLRHRFAERRMSAEALLCVSAGLVGCAIFYLQARGWPYHALPALVLLALALAWEATRSLEDERQDEAAPSGHPMTQREAASASPGERRHILAMLAIVLALSFYWSDRDHSRDNDRIAEIVNETRPRPRLLTIAEDISIGHPLVRQVHGTWTHPVTHLWTAYGVYSQFGSAHPPTGERRERLVNYVKSEVADLAQSIEREKPDIILAQRGLRQKNQFDWLEWAKTWPALAAQLNDYTAVALVDDVEILKRTQFAPAPTLPARRSAEASAAVTTRVP